MAGNMFSVEVPSLYEALLAGERGYKGMRDMQTQNATQSARREAGDLYASGGDTRSAMAKLIGLGDHETIKALGSMQPKGTDEMREYELAKSQGFKGSFFDYKTGLKRAGATNVNTVVNPGEKEFDKKVGGDYGETFVGLQKAGRNAVGTMATLDTMENLTKDPSFYSGPGAERFALPLKQIISRLGGDPNSAASMETFRALSSKSVMDAMGGSLGAGVSNADRDFILSQVASLGNTPEGNRDLIGIHRKVARRAQEVAELSRNYAKKNGGRIDAGFDAVLAQWAEANPLFKDRATAKPSAPKPAASGAAPSRQDIEAEMRRRKLIQ